MNKLHTLIFSTLCITTSISCLSTNPSTHKEVLQYDLAQRKATQKLVKPIRNTSACLMLMGIIGKLLYGDKIASVLHFTTFNEYMEAPFLALILYPLLQTGTHLQTIAFAAFASAIYYANNNLQIEALEAELNKLNHQEPSGT